MKSWILHHLIWFVPYFFNALENPMALIYMGKCCIFSELEDSWW